MAELLVPVMVEGRDLRRGDRVELFDGTVGEISEFFDRDAGNRQQYAIVKTAEGDRTCLILDGNNYWKHPSPEKEAAPAAVTEPPATAEAVSWRCFHCDEVFESRECAALHFGHNEGETPVCKIKGEGEYALIKALRKAQLARDEAWAALSADDTDSARVFHAMVADHEAALGRVEKAGYAKGLADARKEAVHALGSDVAEAVRWARDLLATADLHKRDDGTSAYLAGVVLTDEHAAHLRVLAKAAGHLLPAENEPGR